MEVNREDLQALLRQLDVQEQLIKAQETALETQRQLLATYGRAEATLGRQLALCLLLIGVLLSDRRW